MIDVIEIAKWFGALAAIGGPMIAIWRAVTKLLKRIEGNCTDIQMAQEDIDDSKAERKILIKGVLACLKGLQEQGCNGPVNKAINEIEAFLIERAHD